MRGGGLDGRAREVGWRARKEGQGGRDRGQGGKVVKRARDGGGPGRVEG